MTRALLSTLVSILILLVTHRSAYAQQRPLYSQYLFNGLVLNPAFAGSHEALSVSVSNRSQWSGLEGAPQTFAFASHVLLDPKQLGLGLVLVKDQIGVHKNLVVNGSAAYHLKLSEKDVFSFGLQAGLRNHRVDYLSISGNQLYDPKVAASAPGRTFFDVGAGVYFRNERLEAGISVPGMIPSNWSATDSVAIKIRNAHGLFFFKYSIRLTHSVNFVPSVLLRYYPRVPLSVDVGAGLMFHKAVFTGISYRTNESVDFLLRAHVTPQLSIGYCYDLVVGQISALSTASHEVSASFLFKFSSHKIAPPR
jgi:type IX secretion system PorP/SprF family membrane protein